MGIIPQDELNGFDLGADDYITKPCRIQVLKRRVEAVLRRGTAGSDCFDDGFLRLDFQALTAARNGERFQELAGLLTGIGRGGEMPGLVQREAQPRA